MEYNNLNRLSTQSAATPLGQHNYTNVAYTATPNTPLRYTQPPLIPSCPTESLVNAEDYNRPMHRRTVQSYNQSPIYYNGASANNSAQDQFVVYNDQLETMHADSQATPVARLYPSLSEFQHPNVNEDHQQHNSHTYASANLDSESFAVIHSPQVAAHFIDLDQLESISGIYTSLIEVENPVSFKQQVQDFQSREFTKYADINKQLTDITSKLKFLSGIKERFSKIFPESTSVVELNALKQLYLELFNAFDHNNIEKHKALSEHFLFNELYESISTLLPKEESENNKKLIELENAALQMFILDNYDKASTLVSSDSIRDFLKKHPSTDKAEDLISLCLNGVLDTQDANTYQHLHQACVNAGAFGDTMQAVTDVETMQQQEAKLIVTIPNLIKDLPKASNNLLAVLIDKTQPQAEALVFSKLTGITRLTGDTAIKFLLLQLKLLQG